MNKKLGRASVLRARREGRERVEEKRREGVNISGGGPSRLREKVEEQKGTRNKKDLNKQKEEKKKTCRVLMEPPGQPQNEKNKRNKERKNAG